MFGSTVGVSAPSSACLFVMFHSSIWNLHTKMKKSTKSEPPVRLRQGSHLRWSNTTKQVKLKKEKVAPQLCVCKNYLPGPNPLWVLVDGTAPWRNSCLELSRMSCSPATMETPSLQSLEMGSKGVEVTVME